MTHHHLTNGLLLLLFVNCFEIKKKRKKSRKTRIFFRKIKSFKCDIQAHTYIQFWKQKQTKIKTPDRIMYFFSLIYSFICFTSMEWLIDSNQSFMICPNYFDKLMIHTHTHKWYSQQTPIHTRKHKKSSLFLSLESCSIYTLYSCYLYIYYTYWLYDELMKYINIRYKKRDNFSLF